MPQRTFESEKDVKAEVKKLLNKHGWFWWMPPGTGYGRGGIADFNAIKDGVFIAIETKFGSKKPTPAQSGYLESIAAEHGFGFVVNEKLLGDLDVWLTLFARAASNVMQEEPVSPEDQRDLMSAAAAMMQLIGTQKN
jgi:hypothetical protein